MQLALLLLPVAIGVWLGWRGKAWLEKANQRQHADLTGKLRSIDIDREAERDE